MNACITSESCIALHNVLAARTIFTILHSESPSSLSLLSGLQVNGIRRFKSASDARVRVLSVLWHI